MENYSRVTFRAARKFYVRPRSRWFRHVWRNHRLHHYKNEHYWFGVATAGTADRLLRTYPATSDVETSPTVRALHGRTEA